MLLLDNKKKNKCNNKCINCKRLNKSKTYNHNSENSVTFSKCIFINNHCGDEGGAIYLDSRSSHLTLKNNCFMGNIADDEGQNVFNSGFYDNIEKNWWSL